MRNFNIIQTKVSSIKPVTPSLVINIYTWKDKAVILSRLTTSLF